MGGGIVESSVSIKGNAWNFLTSWAIATIWRNSPLLETSSSRYLPHTPSRLLFRNFKWGVHDYSSCDQLHSYRCLQINAVLTLLHRNWAILWMTLPYSDVTSTRVTLCWWYSVSNTWIDTYEHTLNAWIRSSKRWPTHSWLALL